MPNTLNLKDGFSFEVMMILNHEWSLGYIFQQLCRIFLSRMGMIMFKYLMNFFLIFLLMDTKQRTLIYLTIYAINFHFDKFSSKRNPGYMHRKV